MWSPINYAFSKSSSEMADVFIKFYQSFRDSDACDYGPLGKYSAHEEVIMANIMYVATSWKMDTIAPQWVH